MRPLALSLALLTFWGAWSRADEHELHTFKKQKLTDVFFSEGASYGDFNGDGVMDIVSGPFWYAGPDYKTKHEYYPPKPYDKHGYSDNFFAFTHDFNKDGRTDIFIVGFPDKEAILYVNPGKEGHWPKHAVVDRVGNESPMLVNITGDAEPELVFIHKGTYKWAAPDPKDPTKPWTLHDISPPSNYHHFTHGMGVGDVNGDGRADLLEKDGWWEQPADANKPGPWKHHPVKLGQNGGAQMYAYDVDGDGDNDIITSLNAHAYGLSWYEQKKNGDQIEFVEHKIQGKAPEDNRYGVVYSQLHAIDLVDMDGDGLKDIVTGKRHWAHGPAGDPDSGGAAVVYWYKLVRGKDGVDFIPYLIDNDSGVGTQVVAGDVNGDGLPDVVVGNKQGTFILLHEKKKASAEEWQKAQPKPYTSQSPKEKPGVSKSREKAGKARIAGAMSAALKVAKARRANSDAERIQNLRAEGTVPLGPQGQRLNLDFEKGNLDDWLPEGDAFRGQPVQGDTVVKRRSDMNSRHAGKYWVGTYEVAGDGPRGTLTSAPFRVTQPFATYLIAGGAGAKTRVEIVRADNQKVIHQANGRNTEDLIPILVDLRTHVGKDIFLRLVDQDSGGWGHINFDDFRFHEKAPKLPQTAVLAALDQYEHAGLSPADAAKAMKVPEGFKVTLFAGEPDVQQPIAFTIDERGRLWVAECFTYPIRQPDDKANDRILIFEDTDGDGAFDVRKVFAEKLNLVSGIEVGFGGVFVGAAPYLLFIPDADKDDRPDGPPKILLDGWAFQDTHETLNSFNWGPDGWLYGCHGVFTHSRVGKPGTPDEQRQPINAGIWRYHPTREVFEVFAHGTSNPWGVDFNDQGHCFLTCCVIPHLFHVIPEARYHRQAGAHFNPFTYDDIKTIAVHRHWIGPAPHAGNNRSAAAGGGHAHAGAMIYLGAAWPKQYHNQIFMNNIHGARINEDLLAARGSGYVGNRAPDLVEMNDQWSQIIALRYGPDGQVYMIDWYDANQCHLTDPAKHDRTNGRIFKVSHGSIQPVGKLNLAKLPDDDLVKLQLHANDWYVRQARRILQERGENPKVHEALDKIAFGHEDTSRRLRALWALHVTGGLTEERIGRALASDRPEVRGWGVQLLAEDRAASSTELATLAKLAEMDSSPAVRLAIASAVNRLPVAQRWEIVASLSKHEEDAEDHNLPLMIWYALEPMAASNPDRALQLALAAKIPILLPYTVRRIGSLDSADALAALIEGLGTTTDPSVQRAFLDGIQAALRGRRQVPMPKPWPKVAGKILATPDAGVRAQVERLAVTFGDAEALGRMRSRLMDAKLDDTGRAEALASLLDAKDPKLGPSLQQLLRVPALRGAALRGLAMYDDQRNAGAILAVYGDLAPDEKRDALATLASRVGSAKALLQAVAKKQVASTDLSADLVRQLRNLEDDDLQKLITDSWGLVRESPEEKKKQIEEYKALVQSKKEGVDIALGRAVFAKTCAQCHKLFDAGGNVGPELTGSNRANLDYLLSNVLDPSAVMAKDYQPTVIATTDGRVITGIVKEQQSNAWVVVTANEVLTLPREEVETSRLSDKSMMPDDLLKPLTEPEVLSLVAYLASPAQTPMRATSENVKSFFNGRNLEGWVGNEKLWSVQDGEIVGKTGFLDRNEFLKSPLQVGDFRLKLKVKLTPNAGNSGVQFRSEVLPDGIVRGYQADVGAGWWGKLYEEHGRGLLWDKSSEDLVRKGDWNDYEIVAIGSKVKTYLNGKLCVDLDDPPGAKRGIIALQIHSGPPMEVRFKDLNLALDPKPE
ncbi:MAG: PVC-type heme-binding CxxCH protein [Planctomycetota bacterium]